MTMLSQEKLNRTKLCSSLGIFFSLIEHDRK